MPIKLEGAPCSIYAQQLMCLGMLAYPDRHYLSLVAELIPAQGRDTSMKHLRC